MKKIMAIAMAIVMMMAIAVPAFATTETITGGDPVANETIIKTLRTKEDGSDPTWYTVTIPATQTIYWEAVSTDVNYTISSQLATGDLVYVEVSGNGALINAAGNVLSYTLVNTEYTTTASVVTDEAASVTIDTSASNWTGVPVDVYSDTLTFTASIVA